MNRKGISGVVIAMTIIGFISVGVSLDAMIMQANNALGTDFTPTSGAQEQVFIEAVNRVCEDETGSETLRMSTQEAQNFQITFEKYGEEGDYADSYWVNDESKDPDEEFECKIVSPYLSSDSNLTLNPGVTYLIEEEEFEERVSIQ